MTVERFTQQGPVVGSEDSGYYLWAGIPYAKAITPHTRFKAPEEATQRAEPLDCTYFRASAIQGREGHVLPIGESDDCLFLNIWVPKEYAEDAAAKLPVLFWIHGGGFLGGTGAGYRGGKFCQEQKVVVVTINYRLSCLGFTNWACLVKDTDRFDQNVGLKDQLMALHWVYNNIENFNGDKKHIVIAGESAGSASVSMLLTVPSARQYYCGAIMQSGSLSLIDTMELSLEKATHILRPLLLNIREGLTDESQCELIDHALQGNDFTEKFIGDCILNATTEDIHKAAAQGQMKQNGRLPYGPWFDGELFSSTRKEAIPRMPNSNHFRLLIGHNKHESHLWKMTQIPGLNETVPISSTTLEPILAKLPREASKAIKMCYDLQDPNGWVELSSDLLFVNTTRRVADDLAKSGAAVFRYRLDSMFEIGPLAQCAPHAVDLLAFWDLPWSRSFKDCNQFITDNSESLMKHMRDCWGSFIREGNPKWPKYNDGHYIKIFDCSKENFSALVSELPEESAEKVAAWTPCEL
eukprot:Gregarina_sp_Poly_1__7391@NODE_408_length_8806_cov_149_317199_g332_i0_p2_GENE_NODE_408_length_8806_cov_149_317199_g332_i0NODE_408_length_8806_cov_149_317199_g332_i0_p2_ORF_typecomplete_len523_score72_72COesterase/PF00135_28/1_6e91Abhydrolase_3/PF07859_13/7_6e14Say1_Mug180/PF10340_9/1_7e06Peptidase_S9/PF00326_21/2_4e06Esterase/PF00756_20/0_00024Esterase_phd/PF10503_9/0_011DUF1749/PF08538_10/0_056DUF1749/PF08538_10/5_3e02_NODE_408_length_8806_cov_149_317199_g332_i071908758